MFIKTVFSETELELIHKDLDNALEKEDWNNSAKVKKLSYAVNDPKDINKLSGYPVEQGIISFRSITGPIKDLIRVKLARIDPAVRGYDLNAFYQIWDIGSSIGIHNDYNYMFNATFYLNKDWSVDDGGLYVYTPVGEDQYRVYVPEYNSCSYTNQTFMENHLVTPVTENAREKRYTIHCKGIAVR